MPESYAHRYAKLTLIEWFREKWLYNREHGYRNSYFIFDWQPDPSDGHHGIREEYPLLSRTLTDGSQTILGLTDWGSTYPDLDQDELSKRGLNLECVFDVAVISQGQLKYGLEVVHKHPCSRRKLGFLAKLAGVQCYELQAGWILEQIRRPPKLELLALTAPT